MTFAFDENVSPAIVLALKTLEYPVIHCTEFLPRGTPDEQLFEGIANRDFFLVTQDQNMSRKRHQRSAMLARGRGDEGVQGIVNPLSVELTECCRRVLTAL